MKILAFVFAFMAALSSSAQDIDSYSLPLDAFNVPLQEIQWERDGSIPQRYSGALIRALKPLRVYKERENIAVVTSQDLLEERGVYFYMSASSYRPFPSNGRAFFWNKERGLLEYVFTR